MTRWLHPWRVFLAAFCLLLALPFQATAEERAGSLNRSSTSPQAEEAPPQEMPPGALQKRIDAAAPDSVLTIPRGIYRETAVIDKPLTIIGEPGAEIRGSDIWSSGWERRGEHWYHGGAPQFEITGEWCRDGSNGRCNWPHQVFIDGNPLYQVEGLPVQGQFAVNSAGEIVLADDPASGNVEVTTRTAWIISASDGITIQGFTMRHAADRLHEGALSNGRFSNWTVQGNTLLHAHMAVISIREGGNLKILGNEIAYGGRMGIHSWFAWDVEIAHNRVHSNNTEDFEGGWEAGGMKLSGLARSVVHQNEVFDNNAAGIWCDVESDHVSIEQNRVHHNRRYGILYEISRFGRIVDNQIWENGWGFTDWGFGGGFVCQNCRDTEVTGNVVAWNGDGISMISQARDGYTDVVNNQVRDNVIVLMTDWSQNTYMLAWLEDWSGQLTAESSNNRGANNRYYHAAPEGAFLPFTWGQHERFGLDDLGSFNATGGEENGILISSDDARSILASRDMPLDPESHE
ncbi:MAG: right-handed parallel beta-helix repeat-containing protein [Thermomicrobiales bacterium]